MRRTNLLMVLALAGVSSVFAQSFSSGSTGADGALNCSGSPATVQLPASGVLNYTTVNIGFNCTLSFLPNVTNTPVTMLATGTVTVNGAISLDGAVPSPGPGGFYGGATGQNGVGPGGGARGVCGYAYPGAGTWVGPLNLVPIIGGSGGGGYCINPGGGGGGAIVIASSGSISVGGSISAAGGCSDSCGSSGAIRLVSNSINVNGTLNAAVARLEAPLGNVAYTGSGVVPVVATINPVIVQVNPPTISISSIGGYAAPSATGETWKTVDLLLPTQLQDPITVVVQGTNVPVGSQVTLTFSGSAATAVPATATLSGSTASSSATFSVSGLNRGGVTVLFVTATFNSSQLSASLKQSGPDAVDKIELAAALGHPTRYRFLRKDGSEVSLASLSPELKRMFGY